MDVEEKITMKFHWSIKLAVFVASVISLSWWFCGWRLIHQEPGIMPWALLVFATLATLALISVQAFWIYFEEKAKGTLRKRIEIFEKVYLLVQRQGEVTHGQ